MIVYVVHLCPGSIPGAGFRVWEGDYVTEGRTGHAQHTGRHGNTMYIHVQIIHVYVYMYTMYIRTCIVHNVYTYMYMYNVYIHVHVLYVVYTYMYSIYLNHWSTEHYEF